MVLKSKTLTREEFVSLLVVGSPTSITDPPPRIPVEHSARLIALEFITDLSYWGRSVRLNRRSARSDT